MYLLITVGLNKDAGTQNKYMKAIQNRWRTADTQGITNKIFKRRAQEPASS